MVHDRCIVQLVGGGPRKGTVIPPTLVWSMTRTLLVYYTSHISCVVVSRLVSHFMSVYYYHYPLHYLES